MALYDDYDDGSGDDYDIGSGGNYDDDDVYGDD